MSGRPAVRQVRAWADEVAAVGEPMRGRFALASLSAEFDALYAARAAILCNVELETTAVPTRGVPSTTFESAFNTCG